MTEAQDILLAARARAARRDALHVPIDYTAANKLWRKQKTALTRAINRKDKAAIVLACKKAKDEWNQAGMAWPDEWSRWQRALDDALGWQNHVELNDL